MRALLVHHHAFGLPKPLRGSRSVGVIGRVSRSEDLKEQLFL